jgi:tetratricopeptide (TPR) repeat protein
MVALYLLSGLGASVTSIWWHPVALGVGASGAIFGVAGGLFAFLGLKKVPVPKGYLSKNVGSLGALLLYNLLIGAAIARIDNAAHVGGLITGAVIGALLPLRASPEEGLLRRYAILPLILGAIVVAAPLVMQARVGFAEYAKADRLVRTAQYEEALPLLQDAVRHEPKLQQAQFELGFVCMKLHKNSEAEAAFRKGLELGPDVAAAHFNLALLCREDGRLEEAILELQRAIAIDPKNPKSAYLLGLIYLQKNDSAQAVRWLQNAVTLRPDYAEAKEALAAAEHPSDRVSR